MVWLVCFVAFFLSFQLSFKASMRLLLDFIHTQICCRPQEKALRNDPSCKSKKTSDVDRRRSVVVNSTDSLHCGSDIISFPPARDGASSDRDILDAVLFRLCVFWSAHLGQGSLLETLLMDDTAIGEIEV